MRALSICSGRWGNLFQWQVTGAWRGGDGAFQVMMVLTGQISGDISGIHAAAAVCAWCWPAYKLKVYGTLMKHCFEASHSNKSVSTPLANHSQLIEHNSASVIHIYPLLLLCSLNTEYIIKVLTKGHPQKSVTFTITFGYFKPFSYTQCP